MRRAPIVLVTTVASTAAVLVYEPPVPEVPVVAAAPSAAPSSPGAGSGGSGPTDGTYLGDAVDTRYGPGQVQVTLAGGKITKVEAVQLQNGDRRSAEISSAAAPELSARAVARQTADIDAVSGATITSASYEASLQSALDQAGFEAADGSRGSSEIPDVEEHDGGPLGGGDRRGP